MGSTVLIAFVLTILVVIFQAVFNEIEASPYKKEYYELILKLSENPNDNELKEKAIKVGNEYYSRIKVYGMGNYRGTVSSAREIRVIGPINEKMLYEDMERIIKIKKN